MSRDGPRFGSGARGPGATHHHMEPYQALAAAGRRVILYDQLGCGRSAIAGPHDRAMFTPELYVEEVDAVRDALGLERLHIIGHSWGGMLDELAANPEVYHHMNGPNEFHVIGTIRGWDITDRLGEIEVPTLVMSGKHDKATPAIAETVHQGIRGSEWVLFEHSSHMAQAEEPEKALRVVGEFLDRVERESA